MYLEIACRLLCEYREDPHAMNAARLNVLNNMLGKLGMNPIDRIRLSVPEQPESDPADEYF